MPRRNNNEVKNPNYVPVMTEGVIPDEEMDKLNPLILMQAYDLGFILSVYGATEAFDTFTAKQTELTVSEDVFEEALKVADRSDEAPKIRFKYDEDRCKEAEKTLRDTIKKVYKYIDKLDNDRKPFNRQIKALVHWNDLDRGNILEAVSELPILTNFKSQLSGASPDIFKVPGEGYVYAPPEKILNTTRTAGTQRILMDFYESGMNLADIEMWKNKEKKVGWDSAKEKKYLSYFYESLSRLVHNVEELQKFPDEIQLNEKHMGNPLVHVTARGDIENRSIAFHIGGAKWMMKAIENGWSSDGLTAINVPGIMDGAIQKYKYDYEFSGELEKLKALEEWEKRVFIPFKNEILSKKITSARDMKELIAKINMFDQKLKTDPYIIQNPRIYDYSFKICNQVIIPKAQNRIADAVEREIKNAEKNINKKEIGISENDLQKAELTDPMKQLLNNLKNTNVPAAMEQFAAAYINYLFLNGKVKAAHPELFDEKNENYKPYTDQLVYQCSTYAKELISAIKPENGVELAEMLEFGDHGPYISDIEERIVVNCKKAAMEDLITGKYCGRKPEKSVNDVVAIMKEADRGVYSLNSRFKDTMNGLGEMEEYRKALATDIRAKNLQDGPLVPDEKKMKNLEKKQTEIIKTINSYLTDKINKIRELGGDPDTEGGIDLLGRNGAKRFRAMKQAKKIVLHSINSLKRFKENIPTERERTIHSKRANSLFNIDGSDFIVEATNEMFRRETNKLINTGITEYENRIAEDHRFNSLSAEEKTNEDAIKAHNKAISDSVKKSMCLDMAMKMTADVRNKVMKDVPGKYEHPEIKGDMGSNEREVAVKARNLSVNKELKARRDFYNKAKTELAKVTSSVNELVSNQDGKMTFNNNSQLLKTFTNIINKEGKHFGDRFEKEILEANNKGHILPSNVSELRDTAITKCLKASKEPEDRNRFKAFCEGIGSNAYKKFVADEEAARKAQRQNNAQNVNNGPQAGI